MLEKVKAKREEWRAEFHNLKEVYEAKTLELRQIEDRLKQLGGALAACNDLIKAEESSEQANAKV